MTDIRKVGRRIIDVRNPRTTIKKTTSKDDIREKLEDYQRKNICPECLGQGWLISRTTLDRNERAGDNCKYCGGSGTFEDYIKSSSR